MSHIFVTKHTLCLTWRNSLLLKLANSFLSNPFQGLVPLPFIFHALTVTSITPFTRKLIFQCHAEEKIECVYVCVKLILFKTIIITHHLYNSNMKNFVKCMPPHTHMLTLLHFSFVAHFLGVIKTRSQLKPRKQGIKTKPLNTSSVQHHVWLVYNGRYGQLTTVSKSVSSQEKFYNTRHQELFDSRFGTGMFKLQKSLRVNAEYWVIIREDVNSQGFSG